VGRPSRLGAVMASFRCAALYFVADPFWIVGALVAPTAFALVTYQILVIAGKPDGALVIVGALVMSMWAQALYGSGWATYQDRTLATLEPILGSPVGYVWVVSGRVLWNVVSGVLGAVIVYAILAFTQGVGLSSTQFEALVAIFPILVVSLAATGLLISAGFVFTRYATFYQNMGEVALYVVTGTMFSVALLPVWLLPFSLIFPPTWAVDALRYAVVAGYVGLSWGFVGDIFGAAVLTAVYLSAASWLFTKVEVHVVSRGDITAA